jgi:hypothetical protein
MGPTRLVAEFSMAVMTMADGAETTRLTEIVWGLFDAPVAVTVIAPWYVFAANPEGLTEIVIVPPAAEAVSHVAFETTETARLPPPVFVTETVCEGGVVPPTVYPKLRLELESDITGITEAVPAMMLIASEPLAVMTPTVTMPIP